MLEKLRALFAPEAPAAPLPRLPDGQRVYAVGDIHGRLDLFAPLAEAIEEDADQAAAAGLATTVILLGDLVDRGPDSAAVVAFAREWQRRRPLRILGGNHEEMFLRSFVSLDILRHFLRHGGRETLLSYGVDRKAYNAATIEEVQELMRAAVPPEDRDFIAGFEDMIALGDYLFVHAGIDPEVPVGQQKQNDLRWIREPFLSHPEPFGVVVVHGHTIVDEPQDMGNRIGVDTGAYASGRLTALVLEGDSRRYLTACAQDGGRVLVG